MYPGYDPKNIHYVAWKWGLVPIDLDKALEIMVGDGVPSKFPLVIGKSEEDLKKRFGYLRTLDEAAPYYRFCYSTSFWNGKNVKFLRTSNWMVVFEGGKATDLVLLKGC
jgi:hypothetical protein